MTFSLIARQTYRFRNERLIQDLVQQIKGILDLITEACECIMDYFAIIILYKKQSLQRIDFGYFFG